MGLNTFARSSCSCGTHTVEVVRTVEVPAPPNPDPDRYYVLKVFEVEPYTVVLVHYPGCTNYEGRKILGFKHLSIESLLELTRLDPHFCDEVHCSPIVRFRPDMWEEACAWADWMSKR